MMPFSMQSSISLVKKALSINEDLVGQLNLHENPKKDTVEAP